MTFQPPATEPPATNPVAESSPADSVDADVVIYDGNCNLCVSLVRVLEQLDQGKRFIYVPMQAEAILADYGVTAADCELGMLLIDGCQPSHRWQGSDAAEEIGRRLPWGGLFVATYRWLPGLKSLGDQVYLFVRDNRYRLFGQRDRTYTSRYPVCSDNGCDAYFKQR
jgi:predicted DCC family thiol-disulfide oxidoreductase YuxK